MDGEFITIRKGGRPKKKFPVSDTQIEMEMAVSSVKELSEKYGVPIATMYRKVDEIKNGCKKKKPKSKVPVWCDVTCDYCGMTASANGDYSPERIDRLMEETKDWVLVDGCMKRCPSCQRRMLNDWIQNGG